MLNNSCGMESSRLADEFLSPESTVTSLLSSSGHLRSRLHPPEHNTTFRYREKDYDSASAALDAYIADFERSCQKCSSVTGSLVLPQTCSANHSRARVGTLRNRDVLRERLTDQELDFLHLPVSSLRHHGNRERLSMTTEELLSIPHDGSMPVTHTSAYIQGLMARSHAVTSSFRPEQRAGYAVPHRHSNHLNQHSLPTRTRRSSRCRETPNLSDPPSSAHRAAEPSLQLPHWLSANMDSSGTSSIPGRIYPAWIQRRSLSEPEPELEDDEVPPTHRVKAPSWVSDLEKDDFTRLTPTQVETQQTLRDLRLQLAEQISVLATEKKGSDVLTGLFRDNRIESLIQKADQVLTSLSQSSGVPESPADPGSPINTEELLLSPAARRPSPPQDVPPGEFEAASADRDEQIRSCGSHGNGFLTQPGPVEAVKQMLFRIQAVEAGLERQQKPPAAPPPFPDHPKTPKQVAECEELQSFPGRPSLERALQHLNRLKLLVEEPSPRVEEKEEEEGHSSSLALERAVSSEREAS